MSESWKVLLPGVPVSSSRGALGWCSVCLLRIADRKVLVDTGSYGDRALLVERLRENGLAPEQIDEVFMTHFHFDHVLNFDLFTRAVFHLSAAEHRYVSAGGYLAAKDPYVPAVVYPLLSPHLRLFSGEHTLWPGVRTIPLPGHTPGMTGLLLEEQGVLFAGDGIKNAREYSLGEAPPVFGDPEEALRGYRRAAEIARIIVPGHDNPFRLPIGDCVEYLQSPASEIVYAGEPERVKRSLVLPPDHLEQAAK